MKIYLNKDEIYDTQAVKAFLDDELLYNVNLNGAQYEIILDDHTWIESDSVDENTLTKLLHRINTITNEVTQ